MKTPEQPLRFQGQRDWHEWLEKNYATQDEAWLVILKSNANEAGISYEQAVEEAVSYGWIDGVMQGTQSSYYYLRFSPRKKGSIWSVSNQKRVERLISQGRMTEAGMLKVREARESGEWEAAMRREDISNLPEDLSQALQTDANVWANYEKYSASQKKMFLYWITSAKTDKTRQKRIDRMVEMVTNNQRMG